MRGIREMGVLLALLAASPLVLWAVSMAVLIPVALARQAWWRLTAVRMSGRIWPPPPRR